MKTRVGICTVASAILLGGSAAFVVPKPLPGQNDKAPLSVFDPNSVPFFDGQQPSTEDPAVLAALGVTMAAAGVLASSTLLAPANIVDTRRLSKLLEGTFLGRSPVEKVYKATRDGWSAMAFHNAVDERGSGLVVARGVNGVVFGGYNPNGWRSTDDYYLSSQAFLWYTRGNGVVKLPTLPGGNCAVFDYATAGPTFGSSDLMIGPPRAAIMGGFAGPDTEDMSTAAGNLRQCKSSVGAAYDGDDGWPVRGSAKLTEVEVYCTQST